MDISQVQSVLGYPPPTKILRIKTPGMVTAKPLAVYDSLASVPSQSSRLSGAGHSVSDADYQKSIAPRAVYLMKGQGGRPALLIAPSGLQTAAPFNSQWFRDFHKRPVSTDFASLTSNKVAGKDGGAAMSLSRYQWLQGEFATKAELGSLDENQMLAQANGVAANLWKAQTRGRGISGIVRYWDNLHYHTAGAMYLSPACGDMQAMWGYFNGAEPHTICSAQQPAIAFASNTVIPGALWAGSMSSRCNYDNSGYFYNPAAAGTGSDPIKAAEDALRAEVNAPWAGFFAATQSGSTLPFAYVTARVGYIVGLPGFGGVIMMEFDNLVVDGVTATADLVWSTVDITGADWKRMYPASSLPPEAEAVWAGKIAELPNDFKFRVAYVPTGLDYKSRDYEETIMAVDVVRTGSTLDELFFDSPDDDKPPVSYAALGALSLQEIAKKRNRFVAIALDGAAGDFVSTVAITFSRETGLVVAKQDTVNLDSGEALVAIRAGAATTFSGVTSNEVAVEFFNLANWAAVLTMIEDQAESYHYLIDENRNSHELAFTGTDDELARCLPLLLGFPTTQFAAGVGVQTLGLLNPVHV